MALDVIVLRHGSAGDRLKFSSQGKPDSLRPLEAKGRAEAKRSGKAVRSIVGHVDVVLTSPYLRATQTAAAAATALGRVQIAESDELKPFVHPRELIKRLSILKRVKNVMVVGHEPHLSKFVAYCLTGTTRSFFDIKKGAFVILRFDGQVRARGAKARCLLQPSQLKKVR